MGVSQSRGDECGADCRKAAKDFRSDIAGKSTEDVCESPSISSNRGRLRMIMPKRRPKESCKKFLTASSGEASMFSASPVVASFKTNLACKFNNFGNKDNGIFKNSYFYPTPISTTFLPITTANIAGLRLPLSSTSKRINSQRLATILDIPSPVPSVSEPSDDNASVGETNSARTLECDVVGKVDTSKQDTQPSFNFVARSTIFPNDSTITVTTSQPGAIVTNGLSNDLIPRSPKQYYGGFPATADGMPKILNDGPTTVVNGMSKIGNDIQLQSSGIAKSQPMADKENSFSLPHSKTTTSVVGERQLKRPNTLSSVAISGSKSAWAKLCDGMAPLAQSESFVVENSPAVEIPPCAYGGRQKSMPLPPSPLSINPGSVASKCDREKGEIDKADDKFSPGRKEFGTRALRLQARLKDPSIYADRQRGIYHTPSRIPVVSSKQATVKCNEGHVQLMVNKSNADYSGISRTILSPAPSDAAEPRHFVKPCDPRGFYDQPDSVGGNVVGSTCAVSMASKTNGSPETHRGLIDDEIRDQPDLTIGSESLEKISLSGMSRSSTLKSETLNTCVVAKEIVHKRLRNRTTESYSSTKSSLSVESEDMILDYDGGADVPGDEADTTATWSSVSNNSTLERRRHLNRSSGGSGSWGRQRSKRVVATGKEAGFESVVDEWSSLKDDLENRSNGRTNDVSTGLSASSLEATAVNCSHILKPPASLDCSTMGLEQQTYRHVVQDVTVMKTLLLRLRRVLQEAQTLNPFENSIHVLNGLTKLTTAESEDEKFHSDISQSTNEELQEENRVLRNHIVLLSQQLEDQSRVIHGLQQQLKQCRERNLRRSNSLLEHEGLTISPVIAEKPFVTNGIARIIS